MKTLLALILSLVGFATANSGDTTRLDTLAYSRDTCGGAKTCRYSQVKIHTPYTVDSVTGATQFPGVVVAPSLAKNNAIFPTLPKASAALLASEKSTTPVSIAFLGASTVAGYGSSLNTTLAGDVNRNSMPSALLRLFRQNIGMETGIVAIPPTNLGTMSDGRWVASGDWTPYGRGTAGRAAWLHLTANLDPLQFSDQLAEDWDVAVIQVFQYNIQGDNFTAVVTDGVASGAVVNGTCYNAGGSRYFEYTVTASRPSRENRLIITPTTQNGAARYMDVIRVKLYNSRRVPTLLWGNFGVASTSSADWVGTTSMGNNWDPPANLGACLYLISLGYNDAQNGVTPATWKANIETLISKLPTTADIVLLPLVPGANPTYKALVDQYMALGPQIAAETGITDWTDLYPEWVALNMATADGIVHLTARGYQAFADIIWRRMVTGK